MLKHKLIVIERKKELQSVNLKIVDQKTRTKNKRGTKEYKDFRLKVLKRDNYTCQACGRKNSLHVHHLYPISRYPKYIYNTETAICICRFCHRVTLRREETFIELFIKIINKKQLNKKDQTLLQMLLKQKKPKLFKGGIKMACKPTKKKKQPKGK